MTLVWLILIPFIGGLVCWQTERFNARCCRVIALITMLLVLFTGLWLLFTGQYHFSEISNTPNWTEEFKVPWIPRFGISFHLALDGLSLVMILLTGFLGILAVGCSWREIGHHIGFFHLNLLWIIGAVMGVFLAIDLFLFFFFWEVMLVPMFFLIALWGHSGSKGNTRIRAAIKFFIYTQASGLLMLVSILGLVFLHFNQSGVMSFDYQQLFNTSVQGVLGMMLMLGFFIAFAVKLPVVPLHGWLPDAHAQAPTAGSVDLAGILLKTAAYGLMRFTLPLFPEQSHLFVPIAMILGLIGIYYGAILAFAQTDIKRLIACSSISHMGFVLIAIYSGSKLALQGAIVLMVAHAFSAAGLFIISGQLYERLHTRDMREMGGLFGRVGALPGFALVFVMASLGIPGTGNFVGEFMVLFGTFPQAPWIVVIASGGLILAAVYSLILMQRVYYGPARVDEQYVGLNMREGLSLAMLTLLLLITGFFPQWVLNISYQSMSEVAQWFNATAMLP